MKEAKSSKHSHACPLCPAAFGTAGILTRHVHTVHEKRRDHACTRCAATFGLASSLTKHVRTVHEKRRGYACPHCTAAFGQSGHLATHVRAMHKQLEQLDDEEDLLLFMRTSAPPMIAMSMFDRI